MADPIVDDDDPAWPATFAVKRAPVAAALGDLAVAIAHVGSIAVPGLAAQPLIDPDVAIRNMVDLPEAIARLTRAGYVREGNKGAP